MTGRRDTTGGPRTLLIACGALAHEVVELIRLNRWSHIEVTCLPAIWHNRPEKIPEGVRGKIREARGVYDRVLVAYGDCGTGGLLDRVLEEEGVERIEGPHCYAFFSGVEDFTAQAEADPTCFYLTDYLVRHFDRLMIQGLGLDRHPELLADRGGGGAARARLPLPLYRLRRPGRLPADGQLRSMAAWHS
jgi:hypothetical protein